MANRIKKLIPKLKRAHLFVDKNDIFYLTGAQLEGFWLLVTKKGAVAIAYEMLSGQLKSILKGIEIVSGDNFVETLSDYLRKAAIREVGTCGAKISHALFDKISSKIKLKDDGDIVSDARQAKDRFEIKTIRKACRITVQALRAVRPLIKPGISEEEILFKIEEYFAKHKARPSFPLIVASGPNSANPHHVSSLRKIKRNDVILLDIGCVYKGYCSDLTRTFFLGKTNSLQQKIYLTVKNAHDLALKCVKQGTGAFDVDKAARDVICKAGFGAKFIHSTGHGVGIEIHESPSLSVKAKSVLKAGMAVTVEPGIYLEGNFGVRIEDTVLVTKKGSEVLTK